MRSVKVLFKDIKLKEEQEDSVNRFFKEYSGNSYKYYPVFDEKDHVNAIHFNLVVWISNEDSTEDTQHFIINYENFEDIMYALEDLVINIEDTFLRFNAYAKESTEKKRVADNHITDEQLEEFRKKNPKLKFSSLVGGDGELDVSTNMANVGMGTEQIKNDLRVKTTLTAPNPFKDTFK